MNIIKKHWQGGLILLAVATSAWLYWSPGARECRERGGQYYLDGSCGTFVWSPR